MSIEIFLYTKSATKSGLIKTLKDSGFKKTQHFIKEMNTPEYISFMWFGFENYESSTGVEATVIKASEDEIQNINVLSGYYIRGHALQVAMKTKNFKTT